MDNEARIPAIEEKLRERFLALPKAIQQAITSADIEKQLRELSDVYKLHLDQWQKLENEVMLTLLGLEEAEQLQENIAKEVGVPDDIAKTLTDNIAITIFQPIREELERELENKSNEQETDSITSPQAVHSEQDEKRAAEHPDLPADLPAKATAQAGASAQAGQKLLAAPSTPPPPPPSEKAVRASISEVYKPQQSSSRRANVEEDPYRESIA